VDPTTRLATVLVSLPEDAHLMLETYVAAKITKAEHQAFIVPRDALLPQEGGGYSIFTDNAGHAVKRTVRIGLESDREVQIISDDVKAGDLVIVSGNYELEDGMAVEATAPA